MVVTRHALRNALIPILTIGGLQFGLLLGGAILTETIFSWPGLGRLLYNAVLARDYPVVQGGTLLIAAHVFSHQPDSGYLVRAGQPEDSI